MTWGDSYMLDIEDEKNEISIMAMILAIDAVMASKNQRRGNGFSTV